MKWVGQTNTVGVAPEEGVYVWGRCLCYGMGVGHVKVLCMCREWMVCELV